MAGTSPQLVPSFLGVPCEIRMLIYDKIVGDRVFWINFQQNGRLYSRVLGSLAILRVNKQIRQESQRALKVRTLRLNKCGNFDVKLFSVVPRIVSHWAPTIENVLIGYRRFEFYGLIGIEERPQKHNQILAALKEVLIHLPKMITLTITCDDLEGSKQNRDLEHELSSFSKDLVAFLPNFNRIHVETSRAQDSSLSSDMRVEIKLSKMTKDLQRLAVRTCQNTETKLAAQSNERKVLLDVIKTSDSNIEQWLTINKVNE